MKKALSIMLSGMVLLGSCGNGRFDYPAKAKEYSYLERLTSMIREYSEDDYFSKMTVTIGEDYIVKDGEILPIDTSGSTPYIENGRTMMPVRGIAEALGADVSYDNESQTVTVETEDTVIELTINENEMEINGESTAILCAPELKNDRTMLPVRDVAEALDCEVQWDEETQTATFTRPLQTKRIVVYSESADTDNSLASVVGNGKTVIQYETIDDARESMEDHMARGFYAEPDYIRKADSLSWGADEICGQDYYKQVDYASGSAVVAVVDSGIDYNHQMFEGRIVSGYDFYHGDNYSEEELGHGTMVSGTIIDIAGSNPDIRLMPLKVFGSEDMTSSLLISEAIEYATDNGADVINLSLGGFGYSDLEARAVRYAEEHNVAVVAAAGNKSSDISDTPYSPGSLDGVITVSAIDQQMDLAYFSNYGDGIVEFAAPGIDVRTAVAGGGYTYCDGTSIASPHVAAIYALVKAAHPYMSTAEITEALMDNAVDIGYSGYFGAGLICAEDLELELSEFCEDTRMEDVSAHNAVISGSIEYKGLEPETIGIRIREYGEDDYEEIYSQNFVKNFSFDLNDDADYRLKADTKYECWIFVKQGGIDYGTGGHIFTTEEAPKAKSDIEIYLSDYPVKITCGENYGLRGEVTSDNYDIVTVKGYIKKNGSVIQSAVDNPNSGYMNIRYANLNKNLIFDDLSAGDYTLEVYATDSNGTTVDVKKNFTVESKYIAPEPEPEPEKGITGTVNIPSSWENLSIRKGPGTDYGIIGSMNQGVKCTVYPSKTINGWYYVNYCGIYGYASGKQINTGSSTNTKRGVVSIPSSWDNLSIRTGPGTSYTIVGSMNNGVTCTVYPDKASNGWYYVEYNGITGYAAGNRINLK